MARGTLIRQFTVNLADVERSRFEPLELTLAQHPSETDSYLCTRLLAYCLEYREGIRFAGGGVSAGNEPVLSVHDMDGRCALWVEIGLPDPERLSKAIRRADEVAIYASKTPAAGLQRLSAEAVNWLAVRMYKLPETFIDQLAAVCERRNTLTLTRTGTDLFVECNGTSLQGQLLPITADR